MRWIRPGAVVTRLPVWYASSLTSCREFAGSAAGRPGESAPPAPSLLSLSQKYALLLARTCCLLQPSHSTHKRMNVGRSQAVLRRTATTSGEFWIQAARTHWRRQLPGTGCICPSPGFQKQLIVTLFWSHTKFDGDLLFQISSGFCIYSTVVKISSFFIFFDTNEKSTGLYVTRYV